MQLLCRTCLQAIENISGFFTLDYIVPGSKETIGEKLSWCFPTLNFKATQNAGICYNCLNAAGVVYEFKRQCFQVETQINNYILQKHCVDLVAVKQLNQSQCIDDTTEIKVEENEDQIQSIPDECSLITKNECCEQVDDGNVQLQNVESPNILINIYESASEEALDIGGNTITQINIQQNTEERIHSQMEKKKYKQLKSPSKKTNIKKKQNRKSALKKCKSLQYDKINLSKKFDPTLNKELSVNVKPNNHNGANISAKTSKTDQLFKCSVCDFQTKSSYSLKYHTVIHKEKPFKCPHCVYYFRSKALLEKHLSSNLGKTIMHCSQCDYKSSIKKNFMCHLRIHSNNKLYKCSECNFATITNGRLICHKLTHTKETPHHCKYCDYKTKTKIQLRRHMLVHTERTQQKCSICGYTSAYKAYMREHIRVVHRGKEPSKRFKCKKKM